MKIMKRTAAALIALLIAASAAGCSGGDKSWAAKDDSLTLPIGAYIYNLYGAYASAVSEVPDSSKAVLEQKIDDKDAETWIKDKALNNLKSIFVIDNKMKELGLTLTDDETQTIESATASGWQQMQSTLEKYGIAQSSFQLTYADYYTKYSKVFNAVYGEGGSEEVSDAELKNFFETNYTDFSYMVLPLYSTDSSSGSTAEMTDDEKKTAEKEFDDYAAKIKSGEMTMEQAADAYKTSSGSTDEVLQNATMDLSTDTNYVDSFKDLIEPLKTGEVATGELTEYYVYIIVQKNDITKKTDDEMTSSRASILSEMKGQEFSDEVEKEAGELTGVTFNDAAINSYDPSMFDKEFSSTTAVS